MVPSEDQRHTYRRRREDLLELDAEALVPALDVPGDAERISRIDAAKVVDPVERRDDDSADQIFFGATVTVRDEQGDERTVSIVGIDEIDTARGYISWISPMARALIKSREGDTVTLHTPGGTEELEIVRVRYQRLGTG